ncbi:TetR/AcrR family transcriptional regulator [Umezawaea endophytica]|uniref:TetR family transcriptional regulator n=1 Tax=Umezawaea endophytica TaxID=1654476 RepID=A0A9X3AEW8_9PSEU|nr:TetR/AcrR family transcriptional regulator [Umezawaea endophytica]MCS7476415.1 TetR family transcriptional regulator [Umezawaea endophytica]
MTDRMDLLADAAIEVVAAHGMRGLTHRAVDAEAGVPPGSTSAYFRTRKALVEGLVQRLADLDDAEITTARLDHLAVDGPADVDRLAEGVAALLDHWLTVGRSRSLARFACLLEATHHPELRTILAHGDRPRAQARAVVALAGSTDPDRDSRALVAFVDGLLFDRLAGAGVTTAPPPGTPESRDQLRHAFRAALLGVLRG